MEFNENCPCKRTQCERHKNCVACREHHQGMKRTLRTACERMEGKEKRIKERTKEKNENKNNERDKKQ